MITDQQQAIIERIFKQIVPNTMMSIQSFNESNLYRENVIVGIAKYNQYECLYINIKNITPWQIKTFERRVKKEIPDQYFIESFVDGSDKVTRLGIR